MPLNALIFDVDGTLAETEEIHREAFNATFLANGLDWSWNQEMYKILLGVTGGKERMRYYIEQFNPATTPQLSNDEIAALHKQKTTKYMEIVRSGHMDLRPGVAALIAQARQAGLRLAIATTTSQANVAALLTATLGEESLQWFEVVGAGEHAQHKKPAPDIYLWVLEQLQLSPDSCLAVEDSRNGLLAASAAGLPSLITPSMYTDDEDFSGALEIMPDLTHTSLTALQQRFAP